MRLLEIERYRESVLDGLLSSLASRTDSTQRPAAAYFVSFAEGLPAELASDSKYNLVALAQELLQRANANLGSNTAVIPVLQAFDVLLDADVLDRLQESSEGMKALHDLLLLASRNVARIKNTQRILLCMRIVVRLLPLDKMYEATVPRLREFLCHQYPKIRADTAERLYIVFQTKDIGRETDEVEEVLLETEWAVAETHSLEESAQRVENLLQ